MRRERQRSRWLVINNTDQITYSGPTAPSSASSLVLLHRRCGVSRVEPRVTISLKETSGQNSNVKSPNHDATEDLLDEAGSF